MRLHAGEVDVDEGLVRRLLADQHPHLSGQAVRRIASTGTDHAVFRLGDDLVARLPRIGWAEQQVAREVAWLPVLAPRLPVEVPLPVAVGEPGHGYPYRWLVSPWIDGTDLLAATDTGEEPDHLAIGGDLARFLLALRSIHPDGAPRPGKRGRELAGHDASVRSGIDAVADEIDADRTTAIWAAALEADPWPRPAVWVHGDLLPGNVVVRDGRLTGVIDWGATGVGDPACELMIAWSLSADARSRLRADLEVDDATWARAKGWVIEQAVAFIPYYEASLPTAVSITRQRLATLLADG